MMDLLESAALAMVVLLAVAIVGIERRIPQLPEPEVVDERAQMGDEGELMFMGILVAALIGGIVGEQMLVDMGYPGGPIVIAGIAILTIAGYAVGMVALERLWREWTSDDRAQVSGRGMTVSTALVAAGVITGIAMNGAAGIAAITVDVSPVVGILLSPAVGALLMSLSTVIVAINAQFLRRVDLDLPSSPGTAPSGRPRPVD